MTTSPIRKLATDSRRQEVVTEVIAVTPKQAQAWLDSHENIRPLSATRVSAMAHDMKNGNWKVTHQAICIDENDKLIDGQHRLHAVVEAGEPVRMLVARSWGVTIHDPLDRGTPRRIATLMGRRTREVAATKVLRFFEAGNVIGRPLTLAEAQELYEHHEEGFAALAAVPRSGRLVAGALAASVWAYPCDPDRVTRFVTQVAGGEMIRRGDPAFAFRNWQTSIAGKRSDSENTALACANCLRAFLAGDSLASVYADADSGYRALTTLRRTKRLPHTPPHAVVRAMVMKRGKREDE